MGLLRKAFQESLHPRGFGGKFGHGTGTKKAPPPKAVNVAGRGRVTPTGGAAPAKVAGAAGAPVRKYSATDVASGAALKKRPPVAKVAGRKAAEFPKGTYGPPKKGAAKGPAMPIPTRARTPSKGRKGWVPTVVDGKGPGSKLTIVNDVATLSTPEDFANPENIDARLTPEQRATARKRATAIFENAVNKAPAIRAAIRDAVTEHNGAMGREYDDDTNAPTAVKTEHSTWRKVQGKMVREETDADGNVVKTSFIDAENVSLGDSVRFTAVFKEKNYAEATQSVRAALEALGYTMNEPPPDINDGKGGWALGAYRGLNMTFRNDEGFVYEVQVHTPASLEVAQSNHALYDIVRMKSDESLTKVMADKGPKGGKKKTGIDPAGMTPAQFRAACDAKMHAQAETIPIPAGVAILAKKDAWGQVVKVPRKTGYHSAYTGKGIEKPKKATAR